MIAATDSEAPIYLVDAYNDPVCVQVCGRANYTNCGPVADFFDRLIKYNEKHHFRIDLKNCTGIDSTFLGIIAAAALQILDWGMEGSFQLINVNGRNLEIIENLGLHQIIEVNPTDIKKSEKSCRAQAILLAMEESSVASADTVLKAHESLVRADASNINKFQDVISFLKQQSHNSENNNYINKN